MYSIFFFFNDTATTEIYTLSLHDALPISFRDRGAIHVENLLKLSQDRRVLPETPERRLSAQPLDPTHPGGNRSEEHTSELQSRLHLVCRLLLEKKKQ